MRRRPSTDFWKTKERYSILKCPNAIRHEYIRIFRLNHTIWLEACHRKLINAWYTNKMKPLTSFYSSYGFFHFYFRRSCHQLLTILSSWLSPLSSSLDPGFCNLFLSVPWYCFEIMCGVLLQLILQVVFEILPWGEVTKCGICIFQPMRNSQKNCSSKQGTNIGRYCWMATQNCTQCW
jgi:hypothetical protein